MALPDKREEAKELYVMQSMSCAAIAEQLGVNEGTVYRWKAEAAERGENFDWDTGRRVFGMSFTELVVLYATSIKVMLLKIKEKPEMLLDSKMSDAFTKHLSNLQKLDTRGQHLRVALDLIRVANTWLSEHEPELKTKMEPHWDAIQEALKEYLTKKEIF